MYIKVKSNTIWICGSSFSLYYYALHAGGGSIYICMLVIRFFCKKNMLPPKKMTSSTHTYVKNST